MNESLLEPLMKSPILPELVSELAEAVSREEEKRRRFLEELTPEMKAEFICGEVKLHSPARARHLAVTRQLFLALGNYCAKSGNGTTYAEKCLVSLTRNNFEPDIVWFRTEQAEKITPDQMEFPAPAFVVEVLSQSTEHNDRVVKFEDYALHGVEEYWIVDPDSPSVEQYLLDEAERKFQLHEKLAHGVVRSQVIEGFEIEWEVLFG